MAIFKGAGVAIVTPFNKNNEVDYEKLGQLIEFNIEEEQMLLLYVGQQVKRQPLPMMNI